MKQQKHKRKETFSLIFASNIGNDTRQFYLSVATLRLIIVLMALICITFVWTIFRSGAHYQSETALVFPVFSLCKVHPASLRCLKKKKVI